MAADIDKFVIATSALWAGDFQYFEKLLSDFSPPFEVPAFKRISSVESPEEIIRAVGALRIRQLWRKRSEFKKLAAEYVDEGVEMTDTPNVLQTKHLRATLWRITDREFHLQGYLTDLSWQDNLFLRAHRAASLFQSENSLPVIPPTKAPRPQEDFLDAVRNQDPKGPLGCAWAVVKNPFLQIELSDLCQIDILGLWIEPSLPTNAERITKPFLDVLQTLDEPAVQPNL